MDYDPAQTVVIKMRRRLRYSSVTNRFRYPFLLAPCRRQIQRSWFILVRSAFHFYYSAPRLEKVATPKPGIDWDECTNYQKPLENG